jgi:hypothetical protein
LFDGGSHFHALGGQPPNQAFAVFFRSDDHGRIARMQGVIDVATQFLNEESVRRIELNAMLVAVVLKPIALRESLILFRVDGHFV